MTWRCAIASSLLISMAAGISTWAAADSYTVMKESFLQPPEECRPWTLWWWFGNAVTPEEITRELDGMDTHGIGGVEIFPIYPMSDDDPALGIRNLEQFSDEWLAVFGHTLIEAQKRGMYVQMLAGHGWPLGGLVVTRADAAKRIVKQEHDLKGMRRVSGALPVGIGPNETLEAVIAVRVRDGAPEPGTITDLTDRVTDGSLSWRVPRGDWKLMTFKSTGTAMQVKRATYKAEGFVVDHLGAGPMRRYLDWVAPIFGAAGDLAGSTLITCNADSWEVYQANWTEGFLRTFKEKRGYDLRQFLPHLWYVMGPESRLIRQDFLETVSDLALANYFQLLTDWCHEHGCGSSIQAHGSPADALRAYGTVDIPDGETMWIGSEQRRLNIRSRRLAASAAHLYGKPIVTAESFTWLKMPRFIVPLELLKPAADSLFLEGVNHIRNHGYSYSPPQIGNPGWVFYASTVINHNNTWWDYYPLVARYIARMQYLLRQGEFTADVLLYANQHDARATFDERAPAEWKNDNAWGDKNEPGIDDGYGIARRTYRCALSILDAGYNLDFVNDHALARRMAIVDGCLDVGTTRYPMLVFYETEFVPVATIEKAREFVRQGGTVVFVGRVPDAAPGYLNHRDRSERVRRVVADLLSLRDRKVVRVETLDDLPDTLHELCVPDCVFDPPGSDIGFIHRTLADGELYFVANPSEVEKDVTMSFRVGDMTPEHWDAMTGRVHPVVRFETHDGRVFIPWHFGVYDSAVFVFRKVAAPAQVTSTNVPGRLAVSTADDGSISLVALVEERGEYFIDVSDTHIIAAHEVPQPKLVSPTWHVTFPTKPRKQVDMPKLISWTEIDSVKHFSGTADYRAEIDIPSQYLAQDVRLYLDLGEVREIAEVSVNGQPAGVSWRRPHVLEMTGLARAGRNDLRIRVTNLLHNKVKGLKPEDERTLRPEYGLRTVLYGEKLEELLPSGLLGPVTLRCKRELRFELPR